MTILQVLAARGVGEERVELGEEYVVVDRDIMIKKADLLARAERAIQKGYFCGSDSDSSESDVDCEGFAVTAPYINHIYLDVDSDFSNEERKAIRNAARWWSYAHNPDGKGSNIFIHSIGSEPPDGWAKAVISVTWENLGGSDSEGNVTLARAQFPIATEVSDPRTGRSETLVVPGEEIRFNSNSDASTLLSDIDRFEKVMTHEIGHTLGFWHPEARGTDGAFHISGTQSGENYSTIMHADIGDVPSNNGIYADDAVSAVATYPNSCPEISGADSRFCNDPDCPCDVGEGDCDGIGSRDQCKGNLECRADVGEKYDLPANFDVCEKRASCPAFVGSHHGEFCDDIACPCGVLEGDCDTDAQCGGRLRCSYNVGAGVDKPTGWDICVLPNIEGCPTFDADTPKTAFCTESCPCNLGQGDCDDASECRGGLACAQNVGSYFGLPSAFDVCVDATLTSIDGNPITWD